MVDPVVITTDRSLTLVALGKLAIETKTVNMFIAAMSNTAVLVEFLVNAGAV